VIALLRSGIFDEFPGLRAVIPMIGVAALLFAGIANQEHERERGWRGGPPATTRKRLYVDTMGYDPASIRFAVDLLGAEHVLNGSDWPIMPIAGLQHVKEALTAAGLTADRQAAIMSGNTLDLMKPLAEA
jgi:predicted TIM-barrel fold metal-dependent hydrolase